MKLECKTVEKNGKTYTDLLLSSTNEENNKTYVVRIRPVFWHDLRVLMAFAKNNEE